ncbi:hypothetical protein BV898_19439 [Hypsibius exemplaris]|uniref:Uncharacterized protein n=1 Tax=Hypsibius exemplaris TaxID=2072580 RepID=A0A9X6RNY2_HYPEX|nr:hypothetical protein BV898_19439 [Hypsibius exemplaris]
MFSTQAQCSTKSRFCVVSLDRLDLPHEDVNAIISNIHRKLSGQSAGYEIAKSMNKRLNQTLPEKKRKLKDVRLDSEAGKIWSESSVRMVLVERLNKAAAAAKEKFEKMRETKKTSKMVAKRPAKKA